MRWARGALLTVLCFAAGAYTATVWWTWAFEPEVQRAQVLAREAERIRAEVARVRELCTRRGI